MKNIFTLFKELLSKAYTLLSGEEYADNIRTINYFRMAKKDYGKKLLYIVTFDDGKYTYEHDYVYNMLIDEYKTKNCWKKYGYYTNTNNIPKDALKYVKKI